jgi:Leucine-rich repeat (LRR) protein
MLSGTIPAAVGNFANLMALNLSNNQLEGSIPRELAYLSNLLELDLSFNRLTGSIPRLLGILGKLKRLTLAANQLTGDIPAALAFLSQLQYLDLSSNQLTGGIPPQLAYLKKLRNLILASNQLTGGISSELGELPQLYNLNLSSNRLTGSIPVELSNPPGLAHLDFSYNQLTGSIPPDLQRLKNLKTLHLDFNRLTGAVPGELSHIAGIDYIDFSFNQLGGGIPTEWGNLKELEILDLSNNKLEGDIPFQLGELADIKTLNISSNKLEGSIPSQFKQLPLLLDNRSDFRWNALYTNDETVRDYINSKQIGGNWENTQTITATDVSAQAISGTTVEVSWVPISYTQDDGGYLLFYSRTPAGPYTLFGTTGTKHDSRLEFTGVEPFTPYYFVVKTRTESHRYNQNALESLNSTEVSAITRGSEKIISGRVATKKGEGVPGITMIFSTAASTGITDASGYYRCAVQPGWAGTVKPSKTGYNFEPDKRILDNVTAHQPGIDFEANPMPRSISGYVLSGDEGIQGVTLSFTSNSGETGTSLTDASGYYINDLLPYGWTGRVTPSKENIIFSPGYIEYVSPGVIGNIERRDYQLSVSIILQVSREEERTMVVKKGYGEIEFMANLIGIPPGAVKFFVIYRKENNSDYKSIKEYPLQEPYRYNYEFTFRDKYLDRGKTYTYIGRAINNAGKVIGESKEKAI